MARRKTWTRSFNLLDKDFRRELQKATDGLREYAREIEAYAKERNAALAREGRDMLDMRILEAIPNDTAVDVQAFAAWGGNQYAYYFYPVGADFEFLEYGTGVKVGKGTYPEGIVKDSPRRVPYGQYGQGLGSLGSWVFRSYLANIASPYVYMRKPSDEWAITSGFPAQAPFAKTVDWVNRRFREESKVTDDMVAKYRKAVR